MKKYMKTTLGRKLAAFYFVLFAVSFYFIATFGRDYIYDKVISESKQDLRSACSTLLDSHISQQSYTKDSIRVLRTQMKMASETSNCRILIICDDGDIVVDTGDENPTYNVYHGNASFLRSECTMDYTMDNYLKEPSLCISLQMERNAYLNGYLVFAQSNSFIQSRADYYFNILLSLFYLMAGILALAFIGIYVFNFRPLHKLRNGAKDFSITHENPPIIIHSNDEYGELAQTLNIIGAELSKFDEYQRKFISNISHDFRSPLTSIRGYVQAMADGIIPPEEQEKYLNIILFETDRLTKLTTELLDVNKYSRENIFLEISKFDIHEAIHSTTESLKGTAGEKNISFEFSFDYTVPLPVQGDADKIQQVLHNLIDNAIKFSNNNSCIHISTWTRGDKVFTSIKDTGIGIPKEEQGNIWERFYKTDLSRGKDRLGTGLGLSISKEIIDAHRQTIDVVSTVGVGSEFIFTLPRA